MLEVQHPFTLKNAFAAIESLKTRIIKLEREVRSLKDILNIHNNWHAIISSWCGQEVSINDCNGVSTIGVLEWTDRYNVAIHIDNKNRVRIYAKGNIVHVEKVRS